jgi:hypothetical protein
MINNGIIKIFMDKNHRATLDYLSAELFKDFCVHKMICHNNQSGGEPNNRREAVPQAL